MAPSNQLTWRTIDKFQGLWDNGSLTQMPPNAARIMSGCHPQPNGGLRAFHSPRPWYFNQSGVDHSGAFRIVGVVSSAYERLIITASVDTALTAPAIGARPPAFTPNLVFHHASDDSVDNTPYTQLSLTMDLSEYRFPCNPLSMNPVPLNAVSAPGTAMENTYFILGHGASSAAGALGTIHLDHTGPTLTASTPTSRSLVSASHQSRLVVSYGQSIVFSTPGINDIPSGVLDGTAQFVNLGGSNVAWIAPTPPTDMLVGTTDGAVYNIQGDLSDPVVRTLRNPGSGQCRSCIPTMTARGPVVDLGEGPVIMDTSGEVFPLHEMLQPRHWGTILPVSAAPDVSFSTTTLYRPAYATDGPYIYSRSDGLYVNQLLLRQDANWATYDTDDFDDWVSDNILHLNGSLVYDTDTNSWFRSAHPDVAEIFAPWIHTPTVGVPWTTDRQRNGIITIPSEEHTTTASGDWAWIQTIQNPRAHTFEWLSAPLHLDSGRQVEVKEIQFGASPHTSPTALPSDVGDSLIFPDGLPDDTQPSTVTVYAVNEYGDTDSTDVSIVPGSPRVYTATVRLTGTYVSVGIKSKSPHPDIEAPSIEYVNIGYTEGHVIRDQQ